MTATKACVPLAKIERERQRDVGQREGVRAAAELQLDRPALGDEHHERRAPTTPISGPWIGSRWRIQTTYSTAATAAMTAFSHHTGSMEFSLRTLRECPSARIGLAVGQLRRRAPAAHGCRGSAPVAAPARLLQRSWSARRRCRRSRTWRTSRSTRAHGAATPAARPSRWTCVQVDLRPGRPCVHVDLRPRGPASRSARVGSTPAVDERLLDGLVRPQALVGADARGRPAARGETSSSTRRRRSRSARR